MEEKRKGKKEKEIKYCGFPANAKGKRINTRCGRNFFCLAQCWKINDSHSKILQATGF